MADELTPAGSGLAGVGGADPGGLGSTPASSPGATGSEPGLGGAGHQPPASPGGLVSTPPAGGGAAAASAGTAQTAAPSQGGAGLESIRDVLNRMGAQDLAVQFQDDTALLQHLLLQRQQAQQSAEMARYGQQVVGHWPAVQEFLAQQQQAAKAKEGAPWYQEFWNPPEWNPAWEKQILKDAQGNLHPAPGAPPDVVQRYAQYQQFRNAQVDKLISNPFEFLAPAIKMLARQEAESIAKQQLGQHTDTQFANQFIQQNSSWLYAADATGNQVVDPVSRQPVLSEWGVKFRDHAIQANQAGITDVRAVQAWALKATQLDYLMSQNSQGANGAPAGAGAGAAPAAAAQTPAQTQGAAAKQVFLQNAAGARHQPNVGPQGTNGQPAVNQAGLSLAERLRNKFQAAGVKDSDLV